MIYCNFSDFLTPYAFAVITLKFEKRGFAIEQCYQNASSVDCGQFDLVMYSLPRSVRNFIVHVSLFHLRVLAAISRCFFSHTEVLGVKHLNLFITRSVVTQFWI